MDLRELEPTKRAVSLLEEFKSFAFRGSLIDMAIGIVVGTAFTKLVASFVECIVMPLVSVVMPGQGGYTELGVALPNDKVLLTGQFAGEFVNFLILALAVYLFMVKFLGLLIRKKNEPKTSAAPTRSEELLTEIRDLLKKPA